MNHFKRKKMKEFRISKDFANMSEEERVNALNTATDSKDRYNNYTYYRELSESEIFERMERVNQIWSEVNNIEEQKKELTAAAKPLKAESNLLQKEVSQEQIEFCEPVWCVNNFDTNMIEFINIRGEVVKETRMRGGVQMRLDSAVNE